MARNEVSDGLHGRMIAPEAGRDEVCGAPWHSQHWTDADL